MFDYWRERRKLRRHIAEIDKKYFPRLISEGESAVADHRAERTRPALQLQFLETEQLKRNLKRFGIEASFTSSWKLDVRGEQFYLDEEGLARGWKMVAEARYAWWKKWVDLLGPVVAIAISIIALIISIIALNK